MNEIDAPTLSIVRRSSTAAVMDIVFDTANEDVVFEVALFASTGTSFNQV